MEKRRVVEKGKERRKEEAREKEDISKGEEKLNEVVGWLVGK